MLYSLHKQRVYAYCLRMLGNHMQDAEDATQNAFVHVYGNISTLDHPASFKYWLYTIVRNEVYGRFRRQKGAPFVPFDRVERPAPDSESPHSILERQETANMLQTALERLKPDQREAIHLREFDGLTYAEIAAITESTEDAVRARLFKGRKELARLLSSGSIERKK